MPATSVPPSGGLVIALGPHELSLAGTGFVTVFEAKTAGDPLAGILSADEGRFENDRRLNGDQTHQDRHVRLETNKFSIQRVKLYRYR